MGEDPNVLEGTMKVTTPKFKSTSAEEDDEENANIAETLAGLHDASDIDFIPTTTIKEEESKEEPIVPVVVTSINSEEIVLIEAQGLDDDDDIERQTLSTEPTTLADTTSTLPANRFFLFERLLSFIEQDGELNSVLAGYFSKLFLILVQSKQKEVYSYVYAHPQVFENLVKHLYSKSISEILQKLLANTPSIYHTEDTANSDH